MDFGLKRAGSWARTAVGAVRARAALRRAYRAIASFPRHRGARHDLPAELVVSLTSFPPRYPTLALTLKSLLDQNVAPDRVVLWIAEADMAALPAGVLALRAHGLEIRGCADHGSYDKIIHALEHWPRAFIVTADDDVYYGPSWLETLVRGFDPGRPAIVCRRAYRPRRDARGAMLPYHSWRRCAGSAGAPSATEIFPTGVGGVLYPPGLLADEVTDRTLFTKLCPHGDDLWLYWMGRRAGATYLQVGPRFLEIVWPGSQERSLFAENVKGRNDRQIRALEGHFGPV